jgi:hypothetical protein
VGLCCKGRSELINYCTVLNSAIQGVTHTRTLCVCARVRVCVCARAQHYISSVGTQTAGLVETQIGINTHLGQSAHVLGFGVRVAGMLTTGKLLANASVSKYIYLLSLLSVTVPNMY